MDSRVDLLEFVVVLVGPRPELNLLDGNESLFGLGFLLFLLLLVLILAEVDDAANGRLSLRRNFDEIETFTARDFERLLRRHYTNLGSVLIDHTDLRDSYPLIDAHRWHAIPSVSESSPLKAADSVSSETVAAGLTILRMVRARCSTTLTASCCERKRALALNLDTLPALRHEPPATS